MAAREVVLGGKPAVIICIAKGSGMLAPQLATTLCVVATDAAITPKALQEALARAGPDDAQHGDGRRRHVHQRHRLRPRQRPGRQPAHRRAGRRTSSVFEAALRDLLGEMARAMAADGEGATRMLEVVVSGAPDDALRPRPAPGPSPVTAGEGGALRRRPELGPGPRHGRRAGPARRAGRSTRTRRGWSLQGITVFAKRRARRRRPRGAPAADARDPGRRPGRARRGRGPGAVAWGCDLSYDYVKINADYSSLIVQQADGGVGKDDKVANYSPAFKRSLLVEALKYIAAFSGQVAVIKYGGAAMVKDSLKEAFAEDVALLKQVGLKPVVVHGGAPEITRTLEKLGERSEFVDGMRVTDAQSLPVVEMVLTGKVNQELVALLNARNAGAVGLSGKDGSLLEARKAIHESGRDLGQRGRDRRGEPRLPADVPGRATCRSSRRSASADDGESLSINADEVAAAVAVALGAKKLIYLTDVPGILDSAPDGDLVRQLTGADLTPDVETGAITGGMKWKAQSILAALAGGVERVHVLDGRQPHTVIAELFTDRGVGSLVTAHERRRPPPRRRLAHPPQPPRRRRRRSCWPPSPTRASAPPRRPSRATSPGSARAASPARTAGLLRAPRRPRRAARSPRCAGWSPASPPTPRWR